MLSWSLLVVFHAVGGIWFVFPEVAWLYDVLFRVGPEVDGEGNLPKSAAVPEEEAELQIVGDAVGQEVGITPQVRASLIVRKVGLGGVRGLVTAGSLAIVVAGCVLPSGGHL